MGFVENVQQLDGKLDESECLFCTNYTGLFVDVVKEAYQIKVKKRIEHQDQSTCIHHKDNWLSNTSQTVGFIYRSLQDHVNSIEDIKLILLDDEKRRLLFMKFVERMTHYSSAMDLYLEKREKTVEAEWVEEEAVRLDTQRKKDAVEYYHKAEECIKLTKDYIKGLDFTK